MPRTPKGWTEELGAVLAVVLLVVLLVLLVLGVALLVRGCRGAFGMPALG